VSNFLITIFATAGASAWIYNKLLRQTGNNTKSSAIATTVAGIFIFIAVLLLLNFLSGRAH